MSDDHEHDWRVNPHVIFPSNPPQREVVCAVCGKRERRRTADRPPSHDPQDWPKSD